MNVAAYLRVSTEDQSDKGTIGTQRQEIYRYCERMGFELVGEYADDGVSGTVPFDKRPEAARLLADARAGKFDAVLVYRIDRLGRTTLVILQAFEAFQQLDVTLLSATGTVDLDSPGGILQAQMEAIIAENNRRQWLALSQSGMERLAKEGAWLGGIVPYGYFVEGKGKDGRLRVSEEPIPNFHMSEADVIRLIFSLAAEDGLSCVRIAERLNALGVPPAYVKDQRKVKRGKRKEGTAGVWRHGRILNLLKSSVYKGLHEYGKRTNKKGREVIAREVAPIVDVETWDQAQAVLRGNYRFSRKDAKRQYLLRGIIKCGSCGLTFMGTFDGRSGNGYYRCNGRTHTRPASESMSLHKCETPSISSELEELVWLDIEGFLRNPGKVLEHLEGQRQHEVESVETIQHQIQAITRNIESKDEARRRLIGAFSKGLISEDDLAEGRRDILAEEAALRAERDRLQERAGAVSAAKAELDTAESLLWKLNRRLDGPLTWEVKRSIVEGLVAGIRVDGVDERGRIGALITVGYRFGQGDVPYHIGSDCKVAPVAIPGTRSAPAPAATARSPAT